MGVMCSLLGHDYDDPDVERERTEQGEEVVRTAKRVERCRNCGHTRTVSENTEVTTLEAAAGVVREDDGTVVAATDGMGETDNITIETKNTLETPDETEQKSGTEQESEDELDDESVTVGSIDRIHEHESNGTHRSSNRTPGEWPAEPDTHTETGLSSSGSLTAESETGNWPDETEVSDKTASLQRQQTTGNVENGTTASRIDDRRPGDAFECGSCGFNAVAADSPLRAGDICPDCGHGYLAWETRKG